MVPRPRRRRCGGRDRPRRTSTGSTELREDASVEQLPGAEAAAEAVRETWRLFEELQLQAGLALEALFVKLQRELAGAATPA